MKCVIVTGASRGIGFDTALVFGRAKHRGSIVDRVFVKIGTKAGNLCLRRRSRIRPSAQAEKKYCKSSRRRSKPANHTH